MKKTSLKSNQSKKPASASGAASVLKKDSLESSRKRATWFSPLVLGGLILIILIGGVIVYLATQDSDAVDPMVEKQPTPAEPNLVEKQPTPADLGAMSHNVYGSTPPDKEEILLREAFSLSCSACATYHPALKELREEFKDRIVFQVLHLPLTNKFPNARAGHRAVEAAAFQGSDQFWAMHDILFEQRHLWVAPVADPVPQIKKFAQEIGLDMERFNQDFYSTAVNRRINADEKYWVDKGIRGTPTFLIITPENKAQGGEVLSSIDKSKFISAETGRRYLEDLITQIDGVSESPAEPNSDQLLGYDRLGIICRQMTSQELLTFAANFGVTAETAQDLESQLDDDERHLLQTCLYENYQVAMFSGSSLSEIIEFIEEYIQTTLNLEAEAAKELIKTSYCGDSFVRATFQVDLDVFVFDSESAEQILRRLLEDGGFKVTGLEICN